jgi:hypothetical protein
MIVKESPCTHEFAPVKVALLSGASDPSTCGLSAVQHQFLSALNVPSSSIVPMNFPYLPAYRHANGVPPLWLASWRNLSQFLGASGRAYREPAAHHLQALIDSCDRLLLVTLSCGLEIFNCCLEMLEVAATLHIVALGPVAWRRPHVSHVLIQGGNDYVSRLFFRQVDTRLPRVGHMNYLEQPSVSQLVNEYLSRNLCGNTSE